MWVADFESTDFAGLNVDYESIYTTPLLMRGFDDYHQAWKTMTEAILAVGDRAQPQPLPDPQFDCGDRVWWVADDSQSRSLSSCERGWIHIAAPLPLEDVGQWDWRYLIWADDDGFSSAWLHYCLIWEHELLSRAMAHFSSNSSQYVNSGQF
ncbi:hypothetical protein C7293_24875 [filamentous cyanobacterium CCT1]|nr:hypothetical protein C7293_24875 [filamentous cyanobacterium CCT1]PSN81334.1 hypothetical protein C8B47_01925 [filamentous cyanobacterium CCP4]